MSATVQPVMLAADCIRELIQPYTTTESITQPQHDPDGVWRTRTVRHVIRHPALLTQVQETVTGSTVGGEVFRAAYGSKPAGRIDALAYLERIDRQSKRIADDHGLPRMPLNERLTRISGLIGDKPNRTVKAWWLTARILTQHDEPPYAPDAPCPNEDCERWGSLRIRIEDKHAVCVECQDTWDDEDTLPGHNFDRLAVWIAWASVHLRGLRHWVKDKDSTGYEEELNYRVECHECAPERLERAKREAARLVNRGTAQQQRRAAAS